MSKGRAFVLMVEKPNREHQGAFRQVAAKVMALSSLKKRRLALDYARTGDWSYLIEYLREGSSVTSEMRLLIADALERCSRAKMGGAKRYDRKYEIVKFILEARSRGERERDYSQKAEEKFGQTWRHLRRALEDKELCETVLAHGRSFTMSDVVEPPRHYVGGAQRPPHTYIVNPDTALTPYTMSPRPA
jgi:hypothetical protein